MVDVLIICLIFSKKSPYSIKLITLSFYCGNSHLQRGGTILTWPWTIFDNFCQYFWTSFDYFWQFLAIFLDQFWLFLTILSNIFGPVFTIFHNFWQNVWNSFEIFLYFPIITILLHSTTDIVAAHIFSEVEQWYELEHCRSRYKMIQLGYSL